MSSMTFGAELWRWEARTDSWWFVSVPADLSEEIADTPTPPRGFGSRRVRVTIGGSTWETSVFPESKGGIYVLPVKKAIRTREGLDEGARVEVTVELLDGSP